MAAKRAQLKVEPVHGELADESVCDYDELEEGLRERLADVPGQTPAVITVDSYSAALIEQCRCDVVKFTEFYRIRRA